MTFFPASASAATRFWVVVDLPMPPFPYEAVGYNLQTLPLSAMANGC